jgi:hypothetical protein
MLDIYSRVYRSIFITFNKSWRSDSPHWNAAILYPVMMVLNLIVLIMLLRITKSITNVIDLRILILFLYGSLIVVNYILFIRNKRYRKFEEEFNQLDKSEQRKRFIVGIALSVLGYVIPITLIILMLKFY